MNNVLRKSKEEENNDYKKLNCVVNWSVFISFFLVVKHDFSQCLLYVKSFTFFFFLQQKLDLRRRL